MEIYKEVEGNVSDIYDVSNILTVLITREEELNQPIQIQSIEVLGKHFKKLKAFWITSRNARKTVQNKARNPLNNQLWKTGRATIRQRSILVGKREDKRMEIGHYIKSAARDIGSLTSIQEDKINIEMQPPSRVS